MELTAEQKADRLRQSLYVFSQENNSKCRPYKDVYIVYANDWIYVCDLKNKAEMVWDQLCKYQHEFVDYRVGFRHNTGAAHYILEKCNIN